MKQKHFHLSTLKMQTSYIAQRHLIFNTVLELCLIQCICLVPTLPSESKWALSVSLPEWGDSWAHCLRWPKLASRVFQEGLWLLRAWSPVCQKAWRIVEALDRRLLSKVNSQKPPLYRRGNWNPERRRNVAKMYRDLETLIRLRMEETGVEEVLGTGKDLRMWNPLSLLDGSLFS